MENKGIEIAFTSTPILTKKVTWDFGINAAFNDNEITKLTATDDPGYQGVLTGGIAGGVVVIFKFIPLDMPQDLFSYTNNCMMKMEKSLKTLLRI
jgi:hypothetical protein